MNIKQLITELLKYRLELEVETEGCDCNGTAEKVLFMNGKVIICREDSIYEKDDDYQEFLNIQEDKKKFPLINLPEAKK